MLADEYVTDDNGTGVVHLAPYFGEEDYRVCLKNSVVTKETKPVCPVDVSGRFTDPVVDFRGQYFKDADKNVVKWLKDKGRLVQQSTVKHSYPFCWRSDTPLMYRAVPSWFVRVEHMNDRLLEATDETYWVPDFVKEKRFGNWLRNARDWAVSRNRYWGTPLPVWMSDDGEEVVCVGSVEELKRLTGSEEITDLHRENVDHLTVPSVLKPGTVLRRVSEVFDCWFESGSMPFAQNRYVFEREGFFQADFVAEGVDQTRGWFYTLVVLSTALYGKAPFKNLMCNGLVLAEDGQKMSKSKSNYPDPLKVVEKYGADAVRLYLVNSPVVRADNLRFKEEGVRDVVKDVFLPWYNAHKFLLQNLVDGYVFQRGDDPDNLMDRWILSSMQSLVVFVSREMKAYRLYTVTPRLVKFVDELTNWYVRMNRRRLRSGNKSALDTLFSVLFSLARLMAPFVPFLTEHLYQAMRKYMTEETEDSVHYLMLPQPDVSLVNRDVEMSVSLMQTVVSLGRVVRDRKNLPMKYPLKEVVVVYRDPNDVVLHDYMMEELNVRKVTVVSSFGGVRLRAEPDHKILGSKLKGSFKSVAAKLKNLTDVELVEFQRTGSMDVDGHMLKSEDVRLVYSFDGSFDGGSKKYEAHWNNDMLVMLDVEPDNSMLDEGLAREVVNRVQKLRKKSGLVPSDEVTVMYRGGTNVSRVVEEFQSFMFETLKQPMKPLDDNNTLNNNYYVAEEKSRLKDEDLHLVLVRRRD